MKLYRPETPNAHWLEGEAARHVGKPRTAPYTYPGSRWEWEAGWDYADEVLGVAASLTNARMMLGEWHA